MDVADHVKAIAAPYVDAKNNAGQDVASGGYVAVIEQPGGQKVVRKIAIIR